MNNRGLSPIIHDSEKGCKNNPDCMDKEGVGPIPRGCWEWKGKGNKSPERRNLLPLAGVNTSRPGPFQTHQCAYPFGPDAKAPFCSEGCVVSTKESITRLNALIDAEPGSVLCVSD